ncbi:MAG: flagellar biosynthesis protein FliR [Rhodothermales bacterium]
MTALTRPWLYNQDAAVQPVKAAIRACRSIFVGVIVGLWTLLIFDSVTVRGEILQ